MTIKLLKEKTKRNLKGNKVPAAIAVLIYIIIALTISSISFFALQINKYYITLLAFTFSLFVFAFIQPGYRSLFLNASRNSKINIGEMFNKGFLYKKSLVIQIIIGIIELCLYLSLVLLSFYLYTKTLPAHFSYISERLIIIGNVSLSKILLILPYVTIPLILIMLVLLLTYSMPYYFLLDNPTFSSIKCFRASRKMMKHNKFKLFRLYLSFILWFILGFITFGIAYLWIMPYLNVTIANFYDILKGTYIDQNSKVINNNFNNIMFSDSADAIRKENNDVLDSYNKALEVQKQKDANTPVEEFDIQDMN